MSWQYESTTLRYRATFTTTALSPIIHNPGSLLASIPSRVVVPDASSWSPSFRLLIPDVAARTHTTLAHSPALLSAPNMRCSSQYNPSPQQRKPQSTAEEVFLHSLSGLNFSGLGNIFSPRCAI